MSNHLKYAAECPLCHDTRETVWYRTAEQPDELVCRAHVGHPLHGEQR